MSSLSQDDLRWLDAAARIAMPYRGTTAENPTVGALVVSREGALLGRGVTATGGRPHAETIALGMARQGAKEATLFVTLEPCNHWGKTPPCVEAVIRADVTRVVCGASDPDPRTRGQSIEKLKAAGIEVSVAHDHRPTKALHEGFFSRIERGRPFVIAKLAVSRDGMIGRRTSGNVPITGETARRWTHMQRAFSDAVMVGAGTAILDDPKLTVRIPGLESRKPLRVVMRGQRDIPAGLNLFDQKLGQAAVVVQGNGFNDLAARGISTVFVEGGARLNDSLLDAGLIDRFHMLEGDIEIGADGVPATVHSNLPERLAELGYEMVDRQPLGCDMLTTFEKVQI